VKVEIQPIEAQRRPPIARGSWTEGATLTAGPVLRIRPRPCVPGCVRVCSHRRLSASLNFAIGVYREG